MTTLTLSGNASGAGVFLLEAPSSANTRTITLPDATTTLVGTDATQTLTNKTWASPASSTISSGTTQTAPPATPEYFDFTGIPSWVKRITVLFQGVSTSSTNDILVQIGAGSVTTSGYSSGSGRSSGTSAAGSTSTTGFNIYDNLAANVVSGAMTINLLGSNTWAASHALGYGAGGGIMGGGSIALGGTLDRVRITINGTDTFDAGSINIQYE